MSSAEINIGMQESVAGADLELLEEFHQSRDNMFACVLSLIFNVLFILLNIHFKGGGRCSRC